MKAFASLNMTIGWLVITASRFCKTFSPLHQQPPTSAAIRHFIDQVVDLRSIQALGSTFSFPGPLYNAMHALSVRVFADDGRSTTNGNLFFVAVLLLIDLHIGSIYHVLSFFSYKSNHPARSIGAAEILAASEATDEWKILAATLYLAVGLHVPLHVVPDSKDLFTRLSTKRSSMSKSIRADSNFIRLDFKRRNVTGITCVLIK